MSAAKNVSVIVSLKSTKRDDTSVPGPPAQVSKSGRPNLASAKKEGIDFNQTFTLAPVTSHDAQLIFDIMDSCSDPKWRGTCKVCVRNDLADQLDSNKTLPVLVRFTATGSDGKFEPDPSAKFFAWVKFQYSKCCRCASRSTSCRTRSARCGPRRRPCASPSFRSEARA